MGTHLDFFEAAFGRTPAEFIEIAMMPEEYIINRRKHENNGACEWREAFRALSAGQRADFMNAACDSRANDGTEFSGLLAHYPLKNSADQHFRGR